MRHRKTYMHINFQQIVLVDQSKPCVQLNFLIIASCIHLQLPIVIYLNQLFQTCIIEKKYMHIKFQQNRVSRSVKTVHTNLFAKNCLDANCINLQLRIRILKNHKFRTFKPILRLIGLIDIKLPQKNYFYRRQTDEQTSLTTKVLFFLNY